MIFKKGKRGSASSFFVSFLEKQQDQNKYAFVASKKVGNAVQRNRAKRRLRELCRKNQLLMNPLFDVVFVAKRRILDLKPQQLEHEFKDLLYYKQLWKKS